jgi:hypothetical protein
MRRPDWYDFDSSLQMVREPKGSAEPDMAHLRFLRWMMENRQGTVMDGWLYGPPSGPLAPTSSS